MLDGEVWPRTVYRTAGSRDMAEALVKAQVRKLLASAGVSGGLAYDSPLSAAVAVFLNSPDHLKKKPSSRSLYDAAVAAKLTGAAIMSSRWST